MEEKSKKQSLLEEWEACKKSYQKNIEENMKFDYGTNLKAKAAIAEALTFWKFIQKKMRYDYPQERRDFLSEFLGHENSAIGIVARVESLPTSVWRKILWKENIDFMDFEAFLRRIQQKQAIAIDHNFQDLICFQRTPNVFSRLEVLTKRITVEKLLAEPAYDDLRYERKAEMSYNLLNLDFGFNAYPKGVNDDTKIVEISPLRFLSKKNHSDDFVVNTEDGKYWWLYRNARSNYVWFPSKQVRLKTHICPGFWYTFFVHLVFWVISPAIFLSAICFSDIHNIPGVVALLVSGVFTPLWLVAAAVKFIFTNALTKKTKRVIANFFDRHDEKFEKLGNIFGITIIIGLALAVVGIVLFILYGFMQIFGWFPLATFLALAVMYFGYGFYRKNKTAIFPSFQKFPRYLQIPITLLVAGFTYVACDMYWNYLVLWWPAEFLAITFGIIMLFIKYADRLSSEEALEKVDRVMDRIAYPAMIILATLLVFSLVYSIYLIPMVGLMPLAMMAIFCIGCILCLIVANFFNPSMKNLEEYIRAERLNHFFDANLIRKNHWLYYLKGAERELVLSRLANFLEGGFSSWDDREKAAKLLIPKLTMEIINELQQNISSFRGYFDASGQFLLLKLMLTGKSYQDAHIETLEIIRNRVQRVDGFVKIVERLSSPFVPLWKVLKKIVEYATTFKRIRELFSEYCPYVIQPKVLRFNETEE